VREHRALASPRLVSLRLAVGGHLPQPRGLRLVSESPRDVPLRQRAAGPGCEGEVGVAAVAAAEFALEVRGQRARERGEDQRRIRVGTTLARNDLGGLVAGGASGELGVDQIA
jgi:hypothetical protein